MTRRIRSNEYKEYDRRRKLRIRRERKALAHTLLGRQCAKCGAQTPNLQIDHIDPTTKKSQLTQMTGTLERFLVELSKCQLLCDLCHRVKSNREISGEACHAAKLTEVKVREIRHRIARGEVGRHLATEYGVGPMQISRIKNGKRWKHVK